MNNVELVGKVFEAHFLTGTRVKPEDLNACHSIKKR